MFLTGRLRGKTSDPSEIWARRRKVSRRNRPPDHKLRINLLGGLFFTSGLFATTAIHLEYLCRSFNKMGRSMQASCQGCPPEREQRPDRAGFSDGDQRWPKQQYAETSSVYGCRFPATADRPRHRRPPSPGRQPSSTPCHAAGGTHTARSWGGCCRGPASLDCSRTCDGMSEAFMVATGRSFGRPPSYLLPTALRTVRSVTATAVFSLKSRAGCL
jgi:hypothetical protein